MWALVNMGIRVIWAKWSGPIQMYINKVKKTRVIWTLNLVYVGNFYFIIALEYTHFI